MGKVPAAESTLAVLTFLAGQSRPVAASRIAATLNIPRSTTYDLLGVLVAAGFVIRYDAERAYGLGPAAYELSFAYQRQAPLAIVGGKVARKVVDQLGETCHIAVLQGRDVLYVVEQRATGRPSLVTDVGVRLPAHLTASGRALLGALPTAQLRALYAGVSTLERMSAEGSLEYSPSRVMAEAAETARRGFAVEDGEVTTGLRSHAVPVVNRAGWPIAAVATTFEQAPAGGVEVLREAGEELRRALA